MYNYKELLFPLDISKVLTTIGVTVKLGDKEIKFAHDLADFGGEPETIDATPLSSTVRLNKAGLQGGSDAWTISYYYNDEDYQTIEALKGKGNTAITVTMNNGAVFANTGTVSSNYVTGMGVNAMADAQCSIDLDGAWTLTPATP